MIEYLVELDTQLLLAINGLRSEFLDPFMKIFSGKWEWIPMYLALAGTIIWKFGWRKGLILILAIGLSVACADLATSKLLRPMFNRLRPANLQNPISLFVQIVDGYRGGRHGFPSCHAANTFALAVASSLILRLRPYSIFIFCWAITQCYSRMYLGVHYPADLCAGAVIGSLFGFVAYLSTRKIADRDIAKDETTSQSSRLAYCLSYRWIAVSVGLLTITAIAVYAFLRIL